MKESASSFPTFRDPAGSLAIRSDGVYRCIRPEFAEGIQEFINSPQYARLVSNGWMVASQILAPNGPNQQLLLRHPLVAFRSYPWEWPHALWLSAAELTLDLCADLLTDGWILKDATPLNVLFEGCTPLFVDVASVQRADLKCALWFAYGQFVRSFLLPVLAFSQLGWPLQMTMNRRDGYEPETLYDALPGLYKIKRPALTSVTLPTLLAKRSSPRHHDAARTPLRIANDPEIVVETIRKTLSNLKRDIRRAMPQRRQSQWSDYVEMASHYQDEDLADKLQFVKTILSHTRPCRVLDVGCNIGVYSKLAADLGAEVIAIDTDVTSVNTLATDTLISRRKILPLCVDLAHPTPAIGWENKEAVSFLDRCYGHFNTVLALAVLHHLLLSSQIPLPHVALLLSRLTTNDLIIEWIPPTDKMFISLLRGRGEIYSHLSERSFRDAFTVHFEMADEMKLRNGRTLLHFRKKR